MSETIEPESIRIAFVCVQNAGRSQMASAFASKEVDERGLEDEIELITGGTQPADHVHDVVVEAMHELDIDLSDRTPRDITFTELQDTDIVITMGCTAEAVCPATWTGENRDWDLDNPHERSLDEVRDIRDEIEQRVGALFDELRDEGNPTPL